MVFTDRSVRGRGNALVESCPLDLDGAVMDFKSIADSIHDGRQHSIPICRIPYHYVRRHHVAATADGPDVQVMNVRDPIYAADGGLDCRNVEPPSAHPP